MNEDEYLEIKRVIGILGGYTRWLKDGHVVEIHILAGTLKTTSFEEAISWIIRKKFWFLPRWMAERILDHQELSQYQSYLPS